MSLKPFLLAVLVLALAACGGTSYNGSEGSGGDSSESSGDGDGKDPPLSLPCFGGCENEAELNRPTPGPRPDCPQTEPSLEDNCQDYDDGLLCTYGDSSRVSCRGRYVCREGQWHLPEWLFGQCVEPEDDFCPEPRPQQNEECIVSSAGTAMVCDYENNIACTCIGRGFGGDGEPGDSGWWVCHGPPAEERCPAVIPNLGAGCEHHTLQCQYAPSTCNGATYDTVFCFNGEWELGEDRGCVF